MAQYISKGDLFGRIGTGLGQGIAEQLPKEVERGRLASGLSNLEQQQGLTPFQQFSRLASIPGITPQMIQSGSELLRQQGVGQGLRNNQGGPESTNNKPFQSATNTPSYTTLGNVGVSSQSKGLVDPSTTGTALKPYIPKTYDQILERASQLYEGNRQLYPNPESAINAASQEDQQLLARSQAEQASRQSAIGVEDRLRGQLQGLREASNAQIPDTVFQQVENDVLDKVENGMPELEAAKEGQKKLNEVSRNFSNIRSWGGVSIMTKSPKDLLGSISSLQKDAKKDGYQREAADALVADTRITPQFAYALMYPVSDIKPLNDTIKSLPKIDNVNRTVSGIKGPISINDREKTRQTSRDLTMKAIPKLIKAMGTDGSPLSVAYELDKKGYDSSLWKEYLVENQDSLNLSTYQKDEIKKTQPLFYGVMNDLWLKSFTGLK